MTTYGFIVIISILLSFSLDTLAGYLNIRALREHPPDLFADCVDASTWTRTKEYTQARAILDMTASAVKLVALLIWWFSGGFLWLDRLIGAWNLGVLGAGGVYIGLFLFGSKLISLPFKIYVTFVIEARFGFNKTTPITFVADKAKGLLLSLVLGGPFLIVILAFFHYAQSMAWLYCWGTASAFLIIIQYIAPIWLMPLFNRFSPLPDAPLRQEILEYTRRVQVPIGEVFTMDGSRRSTKANAFVTGFGKYRRIALFDTMIQRYSVVEVVAVLAHEVGHYKQRHIPKMTVLAVLYMGILCGLLSVSMHQIDLHRAFYMEHVTLHGGLIFFILLVVPLDLLMGPVMKWISRHYEYAADRFAVETLRDATALTSALKKLAVDNLSHLTPHPLFVAIHYTHPPLLSRIEAINHWKNRLDL